MSKCTYIKAKMVQNIKTQLLDQTPKQREIKASVAFVLSVCVSLIKCAFAVFLRRGQLLDNHGLFFCAVAKLESDLMTFLYAITDKIH